MDEAAYTVAGVGCAQALSQGGRGNEGGAPNMLRANSKGDAMEDDEPE